MNIEKRNWMPVKPECWLNLRRRAVAVAMVLCVGLLHSVVAQTTPAASTTDANTPAEQFKAFLATPPVVESLVFQIMYYDLHNGHKATPAQMYHARWQTNAFSLQFIKSPEEIDQISASAYFMGKNPDYDWRILNKVLIKAIAKHNKHEYTGAPILEGVVLQALCLGIPNARQGELLPHPGELSWEGNKFKTFEGFTGEATISRDHKVSRIVYHKTGAIDIGGTIDYQYTTNVGPGFLPNLISVSYHGPDNQRHPHTEIALASINLSAEALPLTVFGPERFGFANTNTVVYSNDVLHVYLGGSYLINSTDPKYQPALVKKRPISLTFIFTVFAVSLVALVGIVRKQKTKT